MSIHPDPREIAWQDCWANEPGQNGVIERTRDLAAHWSECLFVLDTADRIFAAQIPMQPAG